MSYVCFESRYLMMTDSLVVLRLVHNMRQRRETVTDGDGQLSLVFTICGHPVLKLPFPELHDWVILALLFG